MTGNIGYIIAAYAVTFITIGVYIARVAWVKSQSKKKLVQLLKK